MSGKNLEAAIRLSIVQQGLENITALIDELNDAGVATGAFEEQAAELAAELDRLNRDQRAVDGFRRLKEETQAVEAAMQAAQAATAESARALKARQAALAATAAAEAAAAAALDSARSRHDELARTVKEAAAELQALRAAAKANGDATGAYAEKIAETKGQLAVLKAEAKTAAGSVAELGAAHRSAVVATKEAAAASSTAEKAFARTREEAGRTKTAFEGQRLALHQTRQALAAAGIDTANLAEHQRKLARTQTDLAERGTQLVHALKATSDSAKLNADQVERAGRAWEVFRKGLAGGAGFVAATVGLNGLGAALGTVRESIAAVLRTGGQFEALRAQLQTLYGSAEEAGRAFEWVREFGRNAPFDMEVVTEAFVKLRAMGLDPMDGSFQAIADQAAALGAEGETLNGIVLALGQAWTKQKLQGEEALQLIERGVPVWELLAKATGKTAVELQELSSKGALGREAIAALIDEMGRMNEGASARALETWNGQMAVLRRNWTDFLNLIAEAGVLDVFRTELTAINEAVEELSRTGELKAWTQEAADAIVGVFQAIKGGVGFIREYGDELVLLGKVAIGLKALALGKDFAGWGRDALGAAKQVRQAVVEMTAARTTLEGMEGAAKKSSGAMAVLGQSLRVAGWAAVTVEIGAIVANLVRLREAKQALADAEDSEAATRRRLAKAYLELSERTGVAVTSTEEFNAAVAAGALVYSEAEGRWVAAGQALREVATAAEDAAAALIAADASALLAEFDALIEKGEKAAEALKNIGAGFDATSIDKIAAFSKALAELEAAGKASAKETGEAWQAALGKLDASKIAAFATTARAAFEQNKIAAEELARINDQVLTASFEKLGLDAAAALGGISTASQEAIGAVDNIVDALEQAGIKGPQAASAIEAAFTAAFSKVDSLEGLTALEARLRGLGAASEVGAEGMARLQAQLAETRKRIEDAAPGIQSVEEAFRNLGIKSSAELKRAAADARAAFDLIKNSGKASAEELAAAFKVYAEAAIAANNGVATESLKVEAAIAGVEITTDKAGKTIVRTMAEAAAETAKVGEKAEDSAKKMGDVGDAAEDSADKATAAAQRTASISAEMVQAMEMVGERAVTTMAQHVEQANRIAEIVAGMAEAATRALDALAAQQERLNSSGLRGVEDLQLRLLELNGTEEEIARARHERDEAQIRRQLALLQLDIQRAALNGDHAEADRLREEIRLYEEQLRLLDKIFAEEERQRKARERGEEPGRRGRGGGGGMSGGSSDSSAGGGTTTITQPVISVTLQPGVNFANRAEAEAIARQLIPVINDLARRGLR